MADRLTWWVGEERLATESGTGLLCKVLGPVEIENGEVRVRPPGRLQRRLLAGLLAGDGHPVSDDNLTALVWGDAWPEDPNALRVVVSRARAALGPGLRDRLERTAAGYRFRVSPEQTDRGRFAGLVADGLANIGENDPHAALNAFTSALRLWRGAPWPELDDSIDLTGARAKLVELHEVAEEERQFARLVIGETAAAVAELSDLAVAAPFRERRWELLALGLYRTGRQTQALAELRRVRTLLSEELGIEPGPALRDLEQRILRHDPNLLVSATPREPSPGEDPPPALGPREAPGLGRPMTSFVERIRELSLLESLRDTARLVTLVGPAGVGKTRLAVEHALTRDEPVWVVRLADAASAAAVAPTVAAAVGVTQVAGDATDLIASTVGDQNALLVLDNCEHVVDPVAALVLRLLDCCPGLRILTTSRQPLDVGGEHTLVVAPLPVHTEDGADGPAVRLLLERVRTARAGWIPGTAELAAARRICAMLDGLPLAIELAAARERSFGLVALAEHLRDGLAVLGSPQRGSVTPHASLTAALGWSVDQLAVDDRAMLMRLWPFEGGFTWSAAAAVRPRDEGGEGGEDPAVLAVLASLVERSVVMPETASGFAHFRLLETVRQYCREHDPDPVATAEAHAAWVRRFVARETTRITAPRAVRELRTLRAELPNIRAGISHDLARRPLEALRTCAALELIWSSLGVLAEGRKLIEAALLKCPEAPVEDRVSGLLALSICAYYAGEGAESLARADEALRLLDEAGIRSELLLKALNFRAGGASEVRDIAALTETCDRFAAESAHLLVPGTIQASALLTRAGLRLMQGRRADAESLLRQAHDLAVRCGFTWAEGTADLLLARTLLADSAADAETGRLVSSMAARAQRVFEEVDDVLDELGAVYLGAHALALLDRADVAVTLRAATAEHAARLGSSLDRFERLGGPVTEKRLAAAPTVRPRAALEAYGRALTWPQLKALLSTESARARESAPASAASPTTPAARAHQTPTQHPV